MLLAIFNAICFRIM